MRTLRAGIRNVRRTPLAVAPHLALGAAGALLIVLGAFPARAEGASATAGFPIGIYFDLKQSLAYGSGWAWAIAALALGVAIRGAVLGGTLWLADGAPGGFLIAWARACRITALAAAALLPAAALYFTGVAIRYAPFVWIGAVAGFFPAALFARRAARLDVGGGEPLGKGVPEVPGFLAYAYVVVLMGGAMSYSDGTARWIAALVVLLVAPVHALFLLGWRENLRDGTYPGGGTLVTGVTALLAITMLASSLFDRYAYKSEPVGRVSDRGSLLVLGGVDSTTGTGALSGIDARDVGIDRSRLRVLSYRGAGEPYVAADTRADLGAISAAVGGQIAEADAPIRLLGHSQASLILDRLIANDGPLPDKAAVLAPSPPFRPPLEVPPPGRGGPGKPGGDAARVLSALIDAVGLQPFDIDAPASPPNLDDVFVPDSGVPRLAVWALGDSVWLDRDWRRPGEVNVVAISDHVGSTNNERALDAARAFFQDHAVADDETSWRGKAATALRMLFAPWRPGR